MNNIQNVFERIFTQIQDDAEHDGIIESYLHIEKYCHQHPELYAQFSKLKQEFDTGRNVLTNLINNVGVNPDNYERFEKLINYIARNGDLKYYRLQGTYQITRLTYASWQHLVLNTFATRKEI